MLTLDFHALRIHDCVLDNVDVMFVFKTRVYNRDF